jgi:hypothetical protein
MYTIQIEEILNIEIEKVFERLSDHANYDRFPGVTHSELLRTGRQNPNGVGACRKIKAGLITFVEDIVGYDPPYLLEYRVVKSSPIPINHKLGRVTLEKQGDRTRVNWISEFEVPFPIIGRIIEKTAGYKFGKEFSKLLKFIEKESF